mmetsp:Transcript_14214/g.30623  ORF Transcript_14214/g.30623 Transcript_14214/m.30623 type:complete len:409 (+) Transcript_14214:241-1467(+)
MAAPAAVKAYHKRPSMQQLLQSHNSRGILFDARDVGLLDRAKSGTARQVERALNFGADPNMSSVNKDRPIHYAAIRKGHASTLQLLINRGAALDAPDASGKHPLQLAVAAGNVLAVKVLLASGADVDCEDAIGNRPLHEAARLGNVQMMSTLMQTRLEMGARNGMEETALHVAARNGNFEVLVIVLDWAMKDPRHGAKFVEAKNVHGHTALDLAVIRGRLAGKVKKTETEQRDCAHALRMALGRKEPAELATASSAPRNRLEEVAVYGTSSLATLASSSGVLNVSSREFFSGSEDYIVDLNHSFSSLGLPRRAVNGKSAFSRTRTMSQHERTSRISAQREANMLNPQRRKFSSPLTPRKKHLSRVGGSFSSSGRTPPRNDSQAKDVSTSDSAKSSRGRTLDDAIVLVP